METHWTHDPGPSCISVSVFIISPTGCDTSQVTNHRLPHWVAPCSFISSLMLFTFAEYHCDLLSVLSGKLSKTLWFSQFFLPPTMLRSLFEHDSSSSKGFFVFYVVARSEWWSLALVASLSRQFCSVVSLSIFLCYRQEFSKTPWQSVPTSLLLLKVYFLSLLQVLFPLSSVQMMSFLTF